MSSTVNNVVIKQGDISDTFEVSPFPANEAVQTLSDPGWTCRSVVVNKLGGDVIIDNTVTDTTTNDLYYTTELAPPDTDILDTKGYIWIIQIQNLTTTPIYRKEHHINLAVEGEGAIDSSDTYTEYAVDTVGTSAQNFTDLYVAVTADHTPPANIRYILFLDENDDIIQRVGYVSAVTNGANKEVTVLEPIIGAPAKLQYVST